MSKILLLIGNRSTARGLQADLKCEGHEVAITTCRVAGLSRAKVEDFDLVILELSWKGNAQHPFEPAAGFRLIRALRKQRFRVILLATQFDEDIRNRARELGAYECIEQPTSLEGIEEFVATVRNALGSYPQDYIPNVGIAQQNQERSLLDEADGDKTAWRFTFANLRRLIHRFMGLLGGAQFRKEAGH